MRELALYENTQNEMETSINFNFFGGEKKIDNSIKRFLETGVSLISFPPQIFFFCKKLPSEERDENPPSFPFNMNHFPYLKVLFFTRVFSRGWLDPI